MKHRFIYLAGNKSFAIGHRMMFQANYALSHLDFKSHPLSSRQFQTILFYAKLRIIYMIIETNYSSIDVWALSIRYRVQSG